MPVTLDVIKKKTLGKTFGKLTVLEYAGRTSYGGNIWRCKCDCGNEIVGETSKINRPNSACTKCKRDRSPTIQLRRTHLIGRVFDRLTVLDYAGNNKYNQSTWKCRCICGNESVVRGTSLILGEIRSCGCLAKDRSIEVHTKHGLSNHPLYAIWWAMKQRCYNPTCDAFDGYGGRETGPITICDEWLNDFMNFYNWAMANGYQKGLSINRIDNDGNYGPNNCEWTTNDAQMQNIRRTKMTPELVSVIRKDPRVHSVIAKEYGVDESTISRIIMRRTWKNID